MLLYCACGNILGEWYGTYFCMRHRGRIVIAREVVEVHCEDCGRTWQADELVKQTGEGDGEGGGGGEAAPDIGG